MELKKIQPRQLGKYIKYFYILRARANEMPGQDHRNLPDGNLELIINLGKPIIQSTSKGWITRPDVFLVGLFDKHFFVQYTGDIYMVGVFFQPGCASLFVNDNLQHYQECLTPADQIMGSSASLLYEQLHLAPTDFEKINILENYLAKQLIDNIDEYRVSQIRQAVNLIHTNEGNVQIPELFKSVNMSERNFRRCFSEMVGLSPKQYSRIVRVKSIVKYYKMNKHSFLDIFYNLGYHDQPHLINDFQQIAGVSPSAFLSGINPIDSQFIKSV